MQRVQRSRTNSLKMESYVSYGCTRWCIKIYTVVGQETSCQRGRTRRRKEGTFSLTEASCNNVEYGCLYALFIVVECIPSCHRLFWFLSNPFLKNLSKNTYLSLALCDSQNSRMLSNYDCTAYNYKKEWFLFLLCLFGWIWGNASWSSLRRDVKIG
jgi:hypothetical protein